MVIMCAPEKCLLLAASQSTAGLALEVIQDAREFNMLREGMLILPES